MKSASLRRLTNPKLLLSLGFLVYSLLFIERTSFIFDGKQYFCLFDDAMISLRYAWKFSHGAGLVWNPGEYVEGYTNPLMVFLMAGVTLVFDKYLAVLVVQLLGIAISLGLAFFVAGIAREITVESNPGTARLVEGLAFAGGLAYYPLTFWSLMGMETGLLTLLMTAALWLAFLYARNERTGYAIGAALTLGLAYLARPDSAVITFLILAYLFSVMLSNRAAWRSKIGLIAGLLAIYGVIVGLHTLFRWLYYGDLVPNTYTLKIEGIPLDERLRNGVGFMLPFLGEIWPVLLLALIGLILRFSKKRLLLVSLFAGLLLYQIYAGGDPWPYWRMVSPAMPLLILLAAETLVLALESWLKSRRKRQSAGYLALVSSLGVILLLLVAQMRFLPELVGAVPPYSVIGNEINSKVGMILSEVTAPDATIGVVTAGAIPYYADRHAYDFLGKADRKIANLPPDLSGAVAWDGMHSVPGHNKYDLDYSIGQLKPDYAEVFKWGRQDRTALERQYYTKVSYKGITFEVRKDSSMILWSKLTVSNQ